MQKVQLALTAFSEERGLTKKKMTELMNLLPDGEVFPVVIEGDSGYAAGLCSNEYYTQYVMSEELISNEIRGKLNDWTLLQNDSCGKNLFELTDGRLPEEAKITYYMDFEEETA